MGLTGNQVEQWTRAQGWAGSPLRRLRRTGAVLHRREPGQNTQDTHDETYALREPQVRRAAALVIAAGTTAAMKAAQASVLRARLTTAPTPSDQPTATVDCTGFTASPLTPDSDG